MPSIYEKFLFRNSQQELQQLFGVAELGELTQRTELIIPKDIFTKVNAATVETLEKVREKFIMFGAHNGSLRVVKEGLGPEFNFANNEFLGDYDGFIKGTWNIYFAPPILVDFHVHPKITREYLKRKNKELSRKGVRLKASLYGQSMNYEQVCMAINLTSGTFHASDLHRAETLNRYARTVMLGSAYGIRWIINPKLKLPYVEYYSDHKNYAAQQSEISEKTIKQFIAEGMHTIDYRTFQQQSDRFLLEFCDRRGLLVFGNNNFKSPNLTRIK